MKHTYYRIFKKDRLRGSWPYGAMTEAIVHAPKFHMVTSHNHEGGHYNYKLLKRSQAYRFWFTADWFPHFLKKSRKIAEDEYTCINKNDMKGFFVLKITTASEPMYFDIQQALLFNGLVRDAEVFNLYDLLYN